MGEITFKFEEMYKMHYPILRNVVENLIDDKDAAHDIVQEVFLKLWDRKDELDAIINKKAYLIKAVINDSIKALQRSRQNLSIDRLTTEPIATANANVFTKELELKIQLALDNLPPKCKAIFILSRFEDMKYAEIADALDISVKTVESQISIALKRMRTELRPYLTREYLTLYFLLGINFVLQFLF